MGREQISTFNRLARWNLCVKKAGFFGILLIQTHSNFWRLIFQKCVKKSSILVVVLEQICIKKSSVLVVVLEQVATLKFIIFDYKFNQLSL